MTVEKVEQLEGRTVFHIFEPTPYGQEDRNRTETVPHDMMHRLNMQVIEKPFLDNPSPTREEHREIEKFEVPKVGTVYFVNDFDTECSSATYCHGAHDTNGPYILRPILTFDTGCSKHIDISENLKSIKPIIEDFGKKIRDYKLETKHVDSGHVFGKGGDDVTNIIARINATPVLEVMASKSYMTSCDDFIDYDLNTKIRVDLQEKEFYPMFEKISEFLQRR